MKKFLNFLEQMEAANMAQQAAIAISMKKAGKKPKKEIEEEGRVARKPGQPANSKKHSDLYTDENPKDTITGLKFATTEDARESVSKIKSSGRSHAHKIQAAVAMEQRAKAADKTEAAAVYRRYIDSTKNKGIREGLWDNIHAKRKRIASGSDERMRKPGSKGAPTASDLKSAAESFELNFTALEEAVKSIDKGEYDYEGLMARTQLQTIVRNSTDLIDMLKDEENMPEWIQSKITLSQDYISTVRDYLHSVKELRKK